MIELFFYLCLSLHFCVVWALPGFVPIATATAAGRPSVDDGFAPSAPAPTTPPYLELFKRDITANVCGWVNGNISEPYACPDPSATCLWNSSLSLVGCGNTQLAPYTFKCVDYTSTSSSKSANPTVHTCSASAPYCNTIQFPSRYFMYPCGTSKGLTVTVSISGTGLPTPAPFPRFMADNGTTFVGGDETDTSNKGAIIAACIGGGVLLLGLPFGIKMVIRKMNWRKMEKAPKTRNLRHPFVREQLPPGPNFLFSQEWQQTPYPKARLPSSGYEMRGDR